MCVVFRMTVKAFLSRIPVFFVFQVTATALGQLVLAIKFVVGRAMIEFVLVEPDDPGIASLVIAMAGLAFQGPCIPVFAVETPLVAYILGHRFMIMAIQA